MFEVKKSRKSKTVLSNNFILFKIPKERVAGIAISEMIQNRTRQALILDNFNFSTRVAQGASNILIPDVTAAQSSNIKNDKAIKHPNCIWENIFGRVIKTNPAPALGSKLKENTAGKIIIPASSAKIVSKIIIVYADFVRLLSSLM